jgi:uncharacterized protein (DUF1778 family)
MKTAQLQIRLTPAQKTLLKRRARAAGQDVSHYVLSRVVPDSAVRFESAVAALADPASQRFALAHLSDLLAELPAGELAQATEPGLPPGLSPLMQNMVTAMTEHAAVQRQISAPPWAEDIPPLESPWFATDLGKLRAHLLRVSPTAFRRRNLFVDATVGDRV